MNGSEVESCVAELRVLADDPRFADRKRDLDSLAADLVDPDGDVWSSIDLFAAFPVAETPRMSHKNRLERGFGVLAAVAVFFPVGWTWWAFKDASTAYEAMVAGGGEPEGRTFLGLWAGGFDGELANFHRLVPTAMWSMILIILAAMALVAHRLLAGRNVRKEEAALHDARRHLLSVLTQASLILQTRRADHPKRIEHIVSSSLSKLAEAHKSVRSVLKSVEKSSGDVGRGLAVLLEHVQSATAEAKTLVESTTAAAETTVAATEQTRTTMQTGTDAIRAAVTASTSAIESSSARSATAIESVVAQGTSDVASMVEEGIRDLERATVASGQSVSAGIDAAISRFESSTVGAINNSAGSLLDAIGQISSSTAESSASARDFSERVGQFAADQMTAQGDLLRVIEQVEKALINVDATLGRHEGALQGQVNELTASRDALERMLLRMTSWGAEPAGRS